MPPRPRLTPAIADVRRAVRDVLASLEITGAPELRGPAEADVLVALSGGPDSLALAAATAFEAPRVGSSSRERGAAGSDFDLDGGLRAGAVVVDHGLQPGSADVAAAAAAQAEALGLAPVIVVRVEVGTEGGPEAAARAARYAALEQAARDTGARGVLLGHTLDDQAETVLLGLARGSGPSSLSGMESRTGLWLRPLLGLRRSATEGFCADSGLAPWHDPQNDDPAFTRVRVRRTLLPLLEQELGPGIVEALGRTADQLREDSAALDHFAEEQAEDLADHAEAGISLTVSGLAANPPALRQRLIRLAVEGEFAISLSRSQTLEVARLVTDWHGQGAVHLPGVTVVRRGGVLHFEAAAGGATSD
ncbi:tRNA(Ile)-lysidine synthase [Frondihabitans sp. PhB188]|uniref:tRNA lysidine(34) synthetase TilS n=1 Tax=Frondihabitans sp. PhB188 TaxID=2485200 RepID=UPI000F48D58E|nr:tRNA lysidine(34) synthetase TilS [Frondihabitans sp. PhB188]ROQ37198.1 tRNA(Ile)-lysidine synthase [Frondihabitans sp. PhB188]